MFFPSEGTPCGVSLLYLQKETPRPLLARRFFYRVFVSSSCNPISSSSSRRLSRATRTASTTKAENVQSLPRIVSSTSDITSTGKRMLFGSVAGIFGILNFRIGFTSIIGLCGSVHFSNFLGKMCSRAPFVEMFVKYSLICLFHDYLRTFPLHSTFSEGAVPAQL